MTEKMKVEMEVDKPIAEMIEAHLQVTGETFQSFFTNAVINRIEENGRD